MEELPGGKSARCVFLCGRIEVPAAFHVLTYHTNQRFAELTDRWAWPAVPLACTVRLGCRSLQGWRPVGESLEDFGFSQWCPR